jgi:hypothetical protein
MQKRQENFTPSPAALLGLVLMSSCGAEKTPTPTACPASQNIQGIQSFTLYSLQNSDEDPDNKTCHLEAVGTDQLNRIVVDGLPVEDSAEWADVDNYKEAFTAAINAVADGAKVTMKYNGKEVELRQDNEKILAQIELPYHCELAEKALQPIQTYDNPQAAQKDLPVLLKSKITREECNQTITSGTPYNPASIVEFGDGLGADRTDPDGKRQHLGVDIFIKGKDLNIYSVYPGKVQHVGWNDKGGWSVTLAHGDLDGYGKNCSTYYAHLKGKTITVEDDGNPEVGQGIVLGEQGDTGNARGKRKHLHMQFSCDKDRKHIYYDPRLLFAPAEATNPKSITVE